MSTFTDIFIRRPVLATVISLLILFVGIRSLMELTVRQFPKMENTVITISTGYSGASAKLVEGFITTPLEKEIAGAEGIDYLTSESFEGGSTIRAFIRLNFDPNLAFTNIMAKVAEVKGALPRESDDPVIEKATGSQVALMYLSFSSKEMNSEQITDYIARVVQPKLETAPGVSEAKLLGGSTFAMRVWLNPQRMAALGVTPNDIALALRNNNFQSTSGKTKGEYVAIPISAKTDIQDTKGFQNVVVKHRAGTLVRLKDVARVELGSEDYDSSVYFNGVRAVFVGVSALPTANPLTVINNVKKLLPKLAADYPPSLKSKVVYDATKYIRSSIKEVIRTILEAAAIVIIVIYLFLGSLRSVVIPIVTIPLSLIGVCSLVLALGYSINLLTLLAMVLAIGMVVDDAIVVVENIHRHIEEGIPALQASLQGAREIAMPIISMTITLAAVYAPIALMGGITGALFKEFAFTLASAVIISGVVALTLSPMMCSKLLTADLEKHRFVHFVDQQFNRLKGAYQRVLHGALNYRNMTIIFSFIVLISCFFLYSTAKKELAPQEDQGVVFAQAGGPQSATLNYMEKFTHEFNRIYRSVEGMRDYFIINGAGSVSSVITAMILKPWDQRKESQEQIYNKLKNKFDQVAGLQISAFQLPPLPTSGGGFPVQFVLTTTSSYKLLYPLMEKLLASARKSGLFFFINGSLKFNKPQVNIEINRSKAAQEGISMRSIAETLGTSLGGGYLNRFSMEGRSYKVIPQLDRRFRLNPNQLEQIYIKTQMGDMTPLASIVSISHSIEPNSLSHFQQLNAATLEGVMMPGTSVDKGLAFLQKEARKILPEGFSFNYGGQLRQFVQEGQKLLYTLFFSIIVIFLVLAAQFESFRDPLVIMISVPMAICGALLPISWGVASINVYTQIGLITLIGLISKHGILMVEFANQLRAKEGLSVRQAIEKAAAIRLRPVVMTTAAMILGVVPLIMASGAGAASRMDIGIVIASGMAVGTLFTLFVIPTMYTLKVRNILLFLLTVFASVFLLYLWF